MKKTTKPNPPRKTAPAPKARKAPQVQYSGTEHHERALCGLVNPFCDAAKGARLPDIGAGKTLTEQLRFPLEVSSDANGDLYLALVPKMNFVFLEESGVTPGNWDTVYSGQISNSLVNTYGQSFRITSMGMKAVSLLSATDSKGVIKIMKGGQNSADLLGVAAADTPIRFTHYEVHSVGPSSEWHVISMPTGSESSDFQPVDSHSVAGDNPILGWEVSYFMGNGLPVSTPVLFVEAVVNVEFNAPNRPVSQLAVPQPIYNPQLLAARNELQSTIMHSGKTGLAALEKHVKDHAKRAVAKHVVPFIKKKGMGLVGAIL